MNVRKEAGAVIESRPLSTHLSQCDPCVMIWGVWTAVCLSLLHHRVQGWVRGGERVTQLTHTTACVEMWRGKKRSKNPDKWWRFAHEICIYHRNPLMVTYVRDLIPNIITNGNKAGADWNRSHLHYDINPIIPDGNKEKIPWVYWCRNMNTLCSPWWHHEYFKSIVTVKPKTLRLKTHQVYLFVRSGP